MPDHKHDTEIADKKAAEEKLVAEKIAAEQADAKRNATPLTDKQRKAGIRMELAKIDQQIADLGVRKQELRAELAAK